MDCQKAEKFLVEYLYQELPAKKTLEIEKHLEVCDHCSKTLESWRSIHRVYQKMMEEPESAPYLKQRILAAAKEELTRKSSFAESFAAFLRPAFILPVILFGLIVLIVIPLQKEQEKVAQAPSVPAMKKQAVELERSVSTADEKSRTETPEIALRKDAPMEELAKKENVSEPSGYDQLKSGEMLRGQKAGDYRYVESKDKEAEQQVMEESQKRDYSPPVAAPPAAQEEGRLAQSGVAEQKAHEPYPKTAKATSPVVTSNLAENNMKLATEYLKNDDLGKARYYAQQAYDQDATKTLADQFYQSGIEFQNIRQCEKAIFQFKQITNNYQKYSNLNDVLLRLGDCYAEIGQIDVAKQTYGQLPKTLASKKLQELKKKQEVQQQLKSLGYAQQ